MCQGFTLCWGSMRPSASKMPRQGVYRARRSFPIFQNPQSDEVPYFQGLEAVEDRLRLELAGRGQKPHLYALPQHPEQQQLHATKILNTPASTITSQGISSGITGSSLFSERKSTAYITFLNPTSRKSIRNIARIALNSIVNSITLRPAGTL